MLSRLLIIIMAASASAAFAQTASDNYDMPSAVQPAGGGEASESDNYILLDTFGEQGVGLSVSDLYTLSAGYRQAGGNSLSMTCDGTLALSINGTGQHTTEGTCTVITDVATGYSLAWSIPSGSGGTMTGYLISEREDVIAPYSPATPGTPETWTVPVNDAEWGARLRSNSTDADAMWGIDSSTEKWLNVSTGSTVIVQRNTATDIDGSDELLQIRVEIGSNRVQPTGVYSAVVVMTATAL